MQVDDDFEEIADEQGWNDTTLCNIAISFIRQAGLIHEFSVFAQEVADEENAASGLKDI